VKIRVVSHHLPLPEGSSSGKALYALCDGLVLEGHDVRVLSFRDEPPSEPLPEWCEWRGVPREPRVFTRARALVRPRHDSARLGWRIPDDAIAIADDVESFAAIEHAGRTVATFHYLTRFDSATRTRRPSDLQTARAEAHNARTANLVIAYSDRVARALGADAVAVPIAFPMPAEQVRAVVQPVAGIIGNWRWPPNRKALDDLRTMWPGVRRRVPEARLLVAGLGSDALSMPASDGVEILGRVDSVEEFWSRVGVLAFPCPLSSGPKVKVIEALAYGVPVVTTPPGVEGIADAADTEVVGLNAFAEALVGVLGDPERRALMARNGRAAVLAAHGPGPAARARIRVLEDAFGSGLAIGNR
jgi:glycosyltransferase involved in cell wall biosynthesis